MDDLAALAEVVEDIRLGLADARDVLTGHGPLGALLIFAPANEGDSGQVPVSRSAMTTAS